MKIGHFLLNILLSTFVVFSLAFLGASTVKAQTYSCQWIGLCELACGASIPYPTPGYCCPPGCNQPSDSDCMGYQSQSTCEQASRQCDCSLPPPSGGSGIYWSQLYAAIQARPGAFGFFTSRAPLGTIISALPGYLFPIAGLLLLIYLVYGGFRFLTSVGDPKNAEAAKHIITQALLGFIIIFVAYWLVQIVGVILGLTQIQGIFGTP